MDYEKAYKEALNWMRSIYPTLAGSDKEDAEHYFPELAESEDERITRAIEILEDYLEWAVSWEGECSYTWKELADAIRLGIDAMKEQKPAERSDCSGCAKHLEGYISGRSDAENKLLEQFGIIITPDGELRMKPRREPGSVMSHLSVLGHMTQKMKLKMHQR